jgi:malate/lactate dehydrogenase
LHIPFLRNREKRSDSGKFRVAHFVAVVRLSLVAAPAQEDLPVVGDKDLASCHCRGEGVETIVEIPLIEEEKGQMLAKSAVQFKDVVDVVKKTPA